MTAQSIVRSVLVVVSLGPAGSVSWAAPIFGGPANDSVTRTTYRNLIIAVGPGSTAGNGVGVGYAERYRASGYQGVRALRWDASGAAVELGDLGAVSSIFTDTAAYAVNPSGTAVGYANKIVGGVSNGRRAVRWDASGTAATELGNLGTDFSGSTASAAYAINDGGTAVGYAVRYSPVNNLGTRAVRWHASGTAATELGNLGTNASGVTFSYADAVNTAGTAVGYATRYSGNSSLGERAVRWDASGTAATELGNLGTETSGFTSSAAWAINASGTAIGYARRYTSNTTYAERAVRWDASGTAATELGNLGTTSNGTTVSAVYAINAAGTSVGRANKYVNDRFLGWRAVRWDASGTAATELGTLGTDPSGNGRSGANAINTAGTIVGLADRYAGGIYVGTRAVYWGQNGVAIDLNTFLTPADAGLWTLTEARGISDTNWVTGYGSFDPDGTGPLAAYTRGFLIQIPAPGTAALLGLGVLAVTRGCRRRR